MQLIRINSLFLIAVIFLGNSAPLEAVIVAGASGVGSENTAAAGLNSELQTQFPYYENVVQVGNGSGVYLGSSGVSGWLITAKHVSVPSSIAVGGHAYGVNQTFPVSGADVAIVELNLNVPLGAPGLPSVPMNGGSIAIGSPVVMAGYGRARLEGPPKSRNKGDAVPVGGSNLGYHWTAERVMRWGTNEVAASPSKYYGIEGGQAVTSVAGVGEAFFTSFDEPTRAYLTTNEAQGSAGDSGGGVFSQNANGDWELTGIMSQIYPDAWQEGQTAAFGNYTLSVYLPVYQSSISGINGGLSIPEPRTPVFLLTGCCIWLLLRRRH